MDIQYTYIINMYKYMIVYVYIHTKTGTEMSSYKYNMFHVSLWSMKHVEDQLSKNKNMGFPLHIYVSLPLGNMFN